ncbi:MAG: hypothetical protein A2Y35_12235 [Spirochaetes bacterium GWE1_60_18]|nr:MAG: hypothetical protein A2Y35_12235 [Spirochaetes bacterium GWE1_60_18]
MILLALVAGLAFLAGACTARSDIMVGFVASLSGIDYMLGVEGRNAAQLFVEELNASGGIAGRRLRLEVRDLASDDRRGPRLAKELVDAGAIAILGFYSSSSALAAIPTMQTAMVPIISPTSTSAELSGKADVFFRTIMTSARDPVVLGGRMRAAGQSRILFLAAAYNQPYYETYFNGLASLVDMSGLILYDSVQEMDYDRIARLALEPGYDAVMIVASSLDTGTIAQNLALRGLLKPLYLSGWAGNHDVITYGGAAVEGASLVHQVDISLTASSALSIAYRAAFNVEPSYAAIETWDSMLLLVAALRQANESPQQLYEALGGIERFEGTAGPILMDSFGDAHRTLYLKQIQDGDFVVSGQDQ